VSVTRRRNADDEYCRLILVIHTPVELPVEVVATRGASRDRSLFLTKATIASLALLIPSFWQSRIQAGDLSSHVYNAWLAAQVRDGHLSGFSFASQWTNVLFDHMLGFLLALSGVNAAQSIAVGVTVLLFFWGAMAWARAETGRVTWAIAPIAGMLAYSCIFRIGFLNFLLSTGLCLLALAAYRKNRFASAVVLLAAATAAHMIPVVWCVSVAAYLSTAERLDVRRRFVLFAAAGAALAVTDIWIYHSFATSRPIPVFSAPGVLGLTGVLPFFLFDGKYLFVCAEILLLFYLIAERHVRVHGVIKSLTDVRVQILALHVLTYAIFPSDILVPSQVLPIAFIDLRITFFFATALVIFTAARWEHLGHKVIVGLACVIFAFFSWTDERTMNRLEDSIDATVDQLPRGSRVVCLYSKQSPAYLVYQHSIDRSCINRCISYANYEATSTHFFLRAKPGNGLNLPLQDRVAFDERRYIVRPEDLPLFVVERCENNRICTEPAQQGKKLAGPEVATSGGWW
jgi:hypothetical protein